jgi:hypothetical protein
MPQYSSVSRSCGHRRRKFCLLPLRIDGKPVTHREQLAGGFIHEKTRTFTIVSLRPLLKRGFSGWLGLRCAVLQRGRHARIGLRHEASRDAAV